MKNNSSLPQDKKLTVVCRIESGCLGPDGKDHIEAFCKFSQKEFESFNSDFVHWKIVPRHDKTLKEIQYSVNNKNLTADKTAKYLEIFEKNLDEFEEHLHDKIANLIDEYLGR